jgi:hypothetical protein
MENNEKQIEEMAKELEKDINTPMYSYHYLASKLQPKGWIKLCEDSVILSKEELSRKYVDRDTYDAEIEYRKVLEKRVSREMVEKIIAKIKQFLSNVETVVEKDKYSLYPEIGYKCSEVDNFIDELANNSVIARD